MMASKARRRFTMRVPPDGEGTGKKQGGNKISSKLWAAGLFMLALLGVAAFLYFDRHNQLSSILRSLGMVGIILAILIKTVMSVTPIPNEALLILYMKIYGAWWGAFYTWVGGVLSSFLMFAIAKHYGRPVLKKLISQNRFEQINHWVKERGALGILLVRLLPIPGYITSYVVGTLPSVRLWTYIWTEAVSVIPYYIGSVLLFMGVMKNLKVWIGVGGAAIAVIWLIGYMARKRFMEKA